MADYTAPLELCISNMLEGKLSGDIGLIRRLMKDVDPTNRHLSFSNHGDGTMTWMLGKEVRRGAGPPQFFNLLINYHASDYRFYIHLTVGADRYPPLVIIYKDAHLTFDVPAKTSSP